MGHTARFENENSEDTHVYPKIILKIDVKMA
jgi:hypothetical protein